MASLRQAVRPGKVTFNGSLAVSVNSAVGHRRRLTLPGSLSQLFYPGEDIQSGLGTLNVFHLCNFADVKRTRQHAPLKLMSLMPGNGTHRASSGGFERLQSADKQSLRPGALEVAGDYQVTFSPQVNVRVVIELRL